MRRNISFESKVKKIVRHVRFNITHKFSYNALTLQAEHRKNKWKITIKNAP